MSTKKILPFGKGYLALPIRRTIRGTFFSVADCRLLTTVNGDIGAETPWTPRIRRKTVMLEIIRASKNDATIDLRNNERSGDTSDIR
jgi:hypothetical protein